MIFGRAENIRILGYLSGFGGAGIGGEFPLKRFDAPLGDFGKVGGAGIEKADDAVEVLDGAFLPSGVGVGIVDGGPENLADGFLVEELAAVVGQDVGDLDSEPSAFPRDAAECAVDDFLAQVPEFPDEGLVAVGGEDHGEESVFAAGPGVDRVHLSISFDAVFPYFFGQVVDAVGRVMVSGCSWRRVLWSAAMGVVKVSSVHARGPVALLRMILEGPEAGERLVLVIIDHSLIGRGDGRPLLEVFSYGRDV